MNKWKRRAFLGAAGVAAGAGYTWLKSGSEAGVWTAKAADIPDEILNPVEVYGPEAVPVFGKLPGERRMYVLPAGQGEHHVIGSQVMTRVSRAQETAGVHEMVTFAGRIGSFMPRHAHLGSHGALLMMGGELELELNGQKWRMMRGDFANIPAGTPHAWTMRSDRTQFALYTMGPRVGTAFAAIGTPQASAEIPAGADHAIAPGKLAAAPANGDFQLIPALATEPEAVRVSNLFLPPTPGPYVILDGGGERFGGNSFYARNANTGGQFLFIITEGPGGGGVGAHFHARHFENFFGMDGETLGWANGKAPSVKSGDYFQAPPRNLHGFKLTQAYNRFAAFLTPGIFESFFTRGGNGQNGVGRPAAGSPVAAGGRGPATGGGGRGGGRGGSGAGGGDMFRALMMSGQGPDGYPLDVHGATKPLPPQDPVWLQQQGLLGSGHGVADRAALLAHAQAICGAANNLSREITPELRRALALKPKAEDFV